MNKLCMAERTLWLLGFVLRVLNVCAILVEEFQMPLTFQHAKICEAFVHYAPGCLYLNPLYIAHLCSSGSKFSFGCDKFPKLSHGNSARSGLSAAI